MATKLRFPLFLTLGGVLIGSLGVGCTDKDGTDSGTPAGAFDNVTVTFNEDFPSVATVSWTTDSPGVSWVDFGLHAVSDRSTPETTSASTEHSVLLLGLAAGESHVIRPSTRLEDGSVLVGAEQTIEVDLAPADLPALTVSNVDATQWEGNGYILTSWMQANASYVVILDRQGRHVWWRAADDGLNIVTSKPSVDGESIIFSQYDRNQEKDIGGVIKQPLAGSAEDAVLTRTLLGHHDFAELPDGRLAWMGFEESGENCNESAGLDAYLSDKLYEKAAGSLDEADNEVIWSYADYGLPDYLCQHMAVDHYSNGTCDWTHGNSLMYDEYQDAYYLMNKNIDNLIKIDRATGLTEWELGGPDSDFTMEGDAGDWWSHAHMSWIRDGEFALFDNRYHEGGGTGTSQASHYVFDEEAKTVQRVWNYVDPNDNFIELLGDVRVLDNGNYLVSWTTLGLITELTPDNQIVWQLETDAGSAIGRVRYLPSLYDLSLAQ